MAPRGKSPAKAVPSSGETKSHGDAVVPSPGKKGKRDETADASKSEHIVSPEVFGQGDKLEHKEKPEARVFNAPLYFCGMAAVGVIIVAILDHFNAETKLQDALNLRSQKRQFAFLQLAVLLMIYVLFELMANVVNGRQKYNVKYPTMYASGDSDEASAFNRVQRAHQNYLTEQLPQYLAYLFFAYQRSPVTSCVCFVVLSLGVKMGGEGYAESVEARSNGMLLRYPFLMVLQGTVWTAVLEGLFPFLMVWRQFF